MPKKRQKATFPKPVNTAHHTFASSGLDNRQNASSSSHVSSSTSVNDLINHLRRTQVSSRAGSTDQSKLAVPRSVHPSLRNVLEVPDTPPPRPRPDARRTGVGGPRLRRTPGPPPPQSWLVGGCTSDDDGECGNRELDASTSTERKILYRLERLPGATFPPENGLVRLLLKSMALNWMWHVEYDGQFLGVLPNRIKVLLLSYIAIYARNQPLGQLMQGLKPLFIRDAAKGDEEDGISQDNESDISRLDLGGALGRWVTFKQLIRELIVSQRQVTDSAVSKGKDAVPLSWEDDYADEDETTPGTLSLPKSPSKGLRFENLHYLSLAHPNPANVNWKSLINLLSRLSTLTHLSLAYWPVPTLTPNAMNARIRHPTQSSISFSYSGTDAYSAMENNWAEAAGVLRKLSRVTYCLKWLDLEGCDDWIPALNWEDTDGDDGVYAPGSTGPEWNQSWRNIEYVRLGPGWLPRLDAIENYNSEPAKVMNAAGLSPQNPPLQAQSRSLEWSIHATPRDLRGENPSSSSQDLPWDVEEERIKYRQSKELELLREAVHSAKSVQRHILDIRKQGRGKWIHFSLGLEDLGIDDLKKLLGRDYVSVIP